jgi:hypothetical protein
LLLVWLVTAIPVVVYRLLPGLSGAVPAWVLLVALGSSLLVIATVYTTLLGRGTSQGAP